MAKKCPPGCKPSTKRSKSKTKRAVKRGNCKKFGLNPKTGKCYKAAPRKRGGVDDAVRAAMQQANARGQYPRMLRLPG